MGDGMYNERHEGNEIRYGYDVTEFITKGLIPRRNFEDFPRAFLLSFQVCAHSDLSTARHV